MYELGHKNQKTVEKKEFLAFKLGNEEYCIDILKVQEEVNNIQEEIEAGAGRVSYLTHAAAYSTIQLTFYEILNAAAERDVKPGFGQRVLNALSNGMDWVGEMLVVVLTLWPLWLLLGSVWWIFRRWKAKPKAGQ